jgi:mannose-1-phosphate guanylyltransferase
LYQLRFAGFDFDPASRRTGSLFMKAFILAAGEGTRLRPMTDSIPKCLVPIGEKPLLAIWLEICRQFGIDEVLVNLHAHAGAVRQFIDSNDFGANVELSEEETLLGSAGTLVANRAWIGDDQTFWIFYGDVLTRMNLDRMMSFHREKGLVATLAVHEVQNPNECGIVDVNDAGVIRGFVEKPEHPASNLAFTGVMIGTQRMLGVIPSTTPADLGFHVFPQLVGSMAGYRTSEYLIDIGTMPKYQAAQKDWAGLPA